MKETNMEHFRSEIENANYKFGVVCGQVVKCYAERCPHCDFFGKEQCIKGAVEWLMSEYKPEPFLTAREKHFVECIDYGWIARDRDGCLMWHEEQPWRYCDEWDSDESHAYIKKEYFSFITDGVSWSVEELRKLKVKE